MKILIVLLALLSGCAAEPNHNPVTVVWHRADTSEVRQEYMRRYGKSEALNEIGGFYYWDQGQCHVYAPDTASKSGVINGELDMLGHEVKHCFDGQFHEGGAVRLAAPTRFYNFKTPW
jgi:hypothetical protein